MNIERNHNDTQNTETTLRALCASVVNKLIVAHLPRLTLPSSFSVLRSSFIAHRSSLIVLLLLAAPALAQQDHRLEELHDQAVQAIEAGDYHNAEQLLRRQKALNPDTYIPWYNLACVLSLSGDTDAALEYLVSAIERGFVDVHHLQRDEHIAKLRKRPEVQRLIDRWPTILDRHLEANLQQAQQIVERTDRRSPTYTTLRDDDLRIAWLSAMDETSFQHARRDIAQLHDWGIQTLFPDQADPEKNQLDAWVVIVLPSPRDFLRWTVATFGPAAAQGNTGIGGLYDHDLRRLVAQDLGPTLRHEYFHILHWRSMTRLGQTHPVWIQEGLCSLVEEYEVDNGTLRPVPSWRTNIVKRLVAAGRAQPLERLASMPREHFTGAAPLANYAQARAFFLFLHDQGKLADWYATYTKHFEADPTGLMAAENVLDMPLEDVQRAYHQWVRNLPDVAEQQRPGDATLGIDVDIGEGDGPVIVNIPPQRRAALREAGLRRNDVITAIDNRPTRDLNELVRILGEFTPGDEVEISYRRGTTHHTTRIRLIQR